MYGDKQAVQYGYRLLHAIDYALWPYPLEWGRDEGGLYAFNNAARTKKGRNAALQSLRLKALIRQLA